MLKKYFIFGNGTYSTKPKSLYKWKPITVQLSPVIILAGVLIMLFFASVLMKVTIYYYLKYNWVIL